MPNKLKWKDVAALVMEGKEDTVSAAQIQELVFAGDPGEYTIPVLQLALSGLKLGLVPSFRRVKQHDPNPGERAWGCLALLTRTSLERCRSPQLQAAALNLIASQSEGICCWVHWHAVRYVEDTQVASSDPHQKAYVDLVTILLDLLRLPGVLDAFMATRQYITLFLHMWTTKDIQSLYLIDFGPEGEPFLSLLMQTVDNTGGNIRGFDILLERLASSKLEASKFAMAFTGRVTQVRHMISGPNPHNEIWTFSRNLVNTLERLLDVGDASHMVRCSFDKSNLLTECAFLLHSIAIAFEQGKVPEAARFSIHNLIPFVELLTRSVDRNYRVPRGWAKLIAGKIDATCARIVRSMAESTDTVNQGLLGTILSVFEIHTVHPVVLEAIIPWAEGDIDPIRATAMQVPDSNLAIKLKQFMVTGLTRMALYRLVRDSKSLFLCDNSSCSGMK